MWRNWLKRTGFRNQHRERHTVGSNPTIPTKKFILDLHVYLWYNYSNIKIGIIMITDKHIQEMLSILHWSDTLCLNPNRHKGTKEILARNLLDAILRTDTVHKAAEYLETTYKVLNTCIERNLVSALGNLNGGRETWNFKLGHLIKIKRCSSCKVIKPYDDYHIDNHTPRGINNECKSCRVVSNAISYKKENVQDSHKRSYEKNKSAIKSRNAQYRADRLLRHPSWADLASIALIYKNCPDGCHVDHEIPLKGKLVSGLHIESNLQWLSAADNLAKGNSFDIDKFNNGELWYKKDIAVNTKIKQILTRNRSPKVLQRLTKTCIFCNDEFLVKHSKSNQDCCSKSCSGKLKQQNIKTESVLRLTKESVEQLIWDKPYSVGCKEVKLSDNGLKKMATRMGCILPPSMYHNKSVKDKREIREKALNGSVEKLVETQGA